MSEYFDRVSETLKSNGYEIIDNGDNYVIKKKYTQKYNVPKRLYSSESLRKQFHAKHIERLKDTFIGYEPCVTIKAESEKERTIHFADEVSEKEKVSALIESMITELNSLNSVQDKKLLHNLFNIKKQYDPKTTRVIFGHVE